MIEIYRKKESDLYIAVATFLNSTIGYIVNALA